MEMYDNLLNSDHNNTDLLQKNLSINRQQDRLFLSYGTGIVNYFNLQEKLIGLFCFLTILAIP